MARPEQLKNGKFRVRWIDHEGKRLGKVFENRAAANLYLKQRQVEDHEVKSGLRAPPQPVMTFFQLCDHWLKYKAANKRSGYHDESIIRAHLKPIIGDLELRNIKSSHGDLIRLKLKSKSDKTVHNILTLFSSLLSCAYSENWILRNIKVTKPSIPIVDKDFRYLKTKDEILNFLTAARKLDEDTHDLYAFAIHTGMRAG